MYQCKRQGNNDLGESTMGLKCSTLSGIALIAGQTRECKPPNNVVQNSEAELLGGGSEKHTDHPRYSRPLTRKTFKMERLMRLAAHITRGKTSANN